MIKNLQKPIGDDLTKVKSKGVKTLDQSSVGSCAFDIYKFLKTRPLSYSSLNLFSDPQWGSPEKWYKTYILGERQSSPQLDFGSMVDKRIQIDKSFIPLHPRYPIMQHEFNIVYNKKIPMTGKPDWIDFDKFLLADTKTGVSPWTQKKADETDQLTAYLFFTYISKKIPPEKFTCRIHWLPTKKTEHGNFDIDISFRDDPVVPVTFETKRTMSDLLLFGEKVNTTVLQMQDYVRNHE